MLHSLIVAGLAATAAADCGRDFLKSATAAYVAAQKAGQSAAVSALGTSANFIFLENNQVTDFKSSTLSKPIKIDVDRSIHDTVQCATFTELIAASNPHPYVIHTRMVFGADHKAALIESIVTDQGDWLFNATGTLELNRPEKWDPIPKEKQDSRAVVQSLGDAYFNRFGNVSVTVPWGAPCYRLEGGLPARGELKGDDCVMVWPSTIIVPYRRYIVDEDLGAVDVFVGFPGLDRTQGQLPMPDSHLFRVEGGKIKYCHTASACVKEGCGLNGTTFGRRDLGLKYRPKPLEF
ncbi:hypothetical protein B0H67DRAFT_486046 [Lasiosphaeris hirsuta]|uniref:DUF8021 domain-containing protein n=1 Tax=Lasiosphaeris hirsuta TaxID=260670 RepID=A0AA40E062_9PEZI|nr:hypothetical protein B0H67DRAFT_486046 [Lasiosphaeris hirsuta]